MNRPNKNEQRLAAKAAAQLNKAIDTINMLGMYMTANERDEIFLMHCGEAGASVVGAIRELDRMAGVESNG